MWISAKLARPRIDEQFRNAGVWLYDAIGIFRGYFVQFELDEPGEDHEYGDATGRRYPSHFWDGEDKPARPPF
jgi:hypothetical protein